MIRSEQALGRRLRELRRRHFGAQGMAAMADRLGVAPEEYARYERGHVPPGEVLVRACEITGEDLQWLLTGVASRATVVISGARNRHRDILTRLANLLDEQPQLAGAVESFVDLLVRGQRAVAASHTSALPESKALIRIYDTRDLPVSLTAPDSESGEHALVPLTAGTPTGPTSWLELFEPAMAYEPQAAQHVQTMSMQAPDGARWQALVSAAVVQCFPKAFGVRLDDDRMLPMFAAGDAVIVDRGSPARVGRPALCRIRPEPGVCCRVWLGEEAGVARLGRLSDGEVEQLPAGELLWSLEALYRLARAA